MYTHAGPGGGIAGDLSVAECSVVDSEYVTEYCQNNMQVSMEKKRYSSGSEDECVEENHENKNRLSVLSEDSAVKNSEFCSTEAELSYSEFSEDEIEKSKRQQVEMEPLVPKTNSEKILFNNIVNSIDAESKRCPSSNELRLVDTTADSLSRSTPNMKLIVGYEAILDNSSDHLVLDETTGQSVTRHNSDCPTKFDPHRYVLDHSEC